jgi:predicted secreted Zn-dependent protease
MSAKSNTQEVILMEIKIIDARIKDNQKTYEKIDEVCSQLFDEIARLESIHRSLSKQLANDL